MCLAPRTKLKEQFSRAEMGNRVSEDGTRENISNPTNRSSVRLVPIFKNYFSIFKNLKIENFI